MFADGGSLTWQVGCQGHAGATKCGNVAPVPGGSASWQSIADSDSNSNNGNDDDKDGGVHEDKLGRQLTAVNVTTYAWVYVFGH